VNDDHERGQSIVPKESLSVEGDMLAATPKSRLINELRAAFRTHKPELMMILGGRAAAARTLVLDFETHYSHDYSLKKLTTEAYVRDERFEALTLAVKGPDICKVFLGPDEIVAWIAAQDWSEITAVFHHEPRPPWSASTTLARRARQTIWLAS
jgi:hypothetical protein